MTLQQLSYIVCVDKHKSFSLAAQECFVTQPTLSMQIQKLEDELGVTIFDRGKKPIAATEIGKMILEQARAVLRESERIKNSVKAEKKEMAGVFRVGIIPTLAPYLLSLFLKTFISKHPKVELIIEELQTKPIIEMLGRDELDAGLLATPLFQKHLVEKPLFYEPFIAYISPAHRLNVRKKISVNDLHLSDLWLLTEGHCFRGQTIRLCERRRPEQRGGSPLKFESGNLDTLRKLVEQNYGMTLMPYLAVLELDAEKKKKFVREFTAPVPKREISLVFNRSYARKTMIEMFARDIIAAVPKELLIKTKSLIVS